MAIDTCYSQPPTPVVDEEGEVNYDNMLFIMTAVTKTSVEILHRPSKATVIVDDVDERWTIRSPWCDWSAELFLNRHRRIRIAPLFANDVGPRSLVQWKGACAPLVAAAQNAMGQLRERKSQQVSQWRERRRSQGVARAPKKSRTPSARRELARFWHSALRSLTNVAGLCARLQILKLHSWSHECLVGRKSPPSWKALHQHAMGAI